MRKLLLLTAALVVLVLPTSAAAARGSCSVSADGLTVTGSNISSVWEIVNFYVLNPDGSIRSKQQFVDSNGDGVLVASIAPADAGFTYQFASYRGGRVMAECSG